VKIIFTPSFLYFENPYKPWCRRGESNNRPTDYESSQNKTIMWT